MIDTVIFDLDGVITKTQMLHANAWKRLFEDFIKKGNIQYCYSEKDYKKYIDGQARELGIESFLMGALNFTKNESSLEISGLASLKNKYFFEEMDKNGVQVYEDAIKAINFLSNRGVKIGLATSSKNSKIILEKINLSNIFDVVVDGNTCSDNNLNSKPEPDIFLWAMKSLNAESCNVVIVEDSLSGAKAGINSNPKNLVHVLREGDVGMEVASLNASCVIQTVDLYSFFKGYLL